MIHKKHVPLPKKAGGRFLSATMSREKKMKHIHTLYSKFYICPTLPPQHMLRGISFPKNITGANTETKT